MKIKVTTVASSKKHTKFKTRVQKPYPTVFMTKTAEKPYPLGLHIRLYIAHRVLLIPPPGVGIKILLP